MSFASIVRLYLGQLQERVEESYETGQLTEELSYRPLLDDFFRQLAGFIDENIGQIFEPVNQSKAGHPDWRFYNLRTMGVYGYVEAKGVSPDRALAIVPHREQIERYLDLGHKLIITDGIDFIFFSPDHPTPKAFSLVSKPIRGSNWRNLEIDVRLENEFRSFFKDEGFRKCSEEQLIEEVAKRAIQISKNIRELADLPPGSGLSRQENMSIEALHELKPILENHHDVRLQTPQAFADFVAQVLTFGLLYAHRVVKGDNDDPVDRYNKIKDFWLSTVYRDYTKKLRPFRGLVEILGDDLQSLSSLGTWYQDCCLLLAHVKLEDEQRKTPDYHSLFEHFLEVFDPQTRFDFGAFYTPSELAGFAVKLTQAIVQKELDGSSLYEKGNKLIDPCCGTGTFLEHLIVYSDSKSHLPDIIGFEILPAPYALTHYRLSMLYNKKATPKNISIILTDTLSDDLEEVTPAEPTDLISIEQDVARKLSRPPLTLVIGNPPSSDKSSHVEQGNQSIVDRLLEDYRPPKEDRASRQNTQKQLKNEFVKFLRWSCNKLEDSDPGILTLVLPSSFAEHPSYLYAREKIVSQFDKLWILDLDLDGRTGIRSSGLFHTLQGRMLIVGLTESKGKKRKKAYYATITDLTRSEKLHELTKERSPIEYINMFKEFEVETETFSLRPRGEFDQDFYSSFWPLYPERKEPEDGEEYIFKNHCSGIKFAPSTMFVHTQKEILLRRSRYISDMSNNVESIMSQWFSGQDRPPADSKFSREVRERIGEAIHLRPQPVYPYSYRPLVNVSALIHEPILNELSKTGGGGTRARPEVLSAFRDPNTIGISIAPATKDIGETLHRFASFCWYTPDNDLCKRGNAHVFCNKFPEYKTGKSWDPTPIMNINPSLQEKIAHLIGKTPEESADLIVFYVYGILCSNLFLDEFEGALFNYADRTYRPRIPFPNDKDTFMNIAKNGHKLAKLEKNDIDLVLPREYLAMETLFRHPFHLQNYQINEDEEKIELIGDNGETITLNSINPQVLTFQVSGYNVLQQWLKIYSSRYSRKQFSIDDYRELIKLLFKIGLQIEIVKELDDEIRPILKKEIELL